MLPIQGDKDPVVLPKRTRNFVEKMKTVGAKIEYLEVEGQHGVAYNGKFNRASH